MCLRSYLDDIRELLQRLLISGFHSLQVLGFDNLLLNPGASCVHHHLQEFLLLRVKNSVENCFTCYLYQAPIYNRVQRCFTCTPNRKVKARPAFPALAVLPILNKNRKDRTKSQSTVNKTTWGITNNPLTLYRNVTES